MTFQRAGARGTSYRNKINPVILHIAYEGAVDEKEYFAGLSCKIPKKFSNYIKLIPVEKSNTDSAPMKVLDDLVDHISKNKVRLNDGINKAFIVIDKDHHFTGAHNRDASLCIQLCRQKGVEIICSTPSFELWLLCHYLNIHEMDDEFKNKAFLNKDDFLKRHFAACRNGAHVHEIIAKTSIAFANALALEQLSTNVDSIPPDCLQTNMTKLFHEFIENGIPLPV